MGQSFRPIFGLRRIDSKASCARGADEATRQNSVARVVVRRTPSLKRPLIVYPLAFHLATLMVSFVILLAVTIRIDSGGPYADEQITPVIARAITRLMVRVRG